jgi:uncharacterized protein (TIGR02452 family)
MAILPTGDGLARDLEAMAEPLRRPLGVGAARGAAGLLRVARGRRRIAFEGAVTARRAGFAMHSRCGITRGEEADGRGGESRKKQGRDFHANEVTSNLDRTNRLGAPEACSSARQEAAVRRVPSCMRPLGREESDGAVAGNHREELTRVATDTLAIIERGSYDVGERTVEIRADMTRALAGVTAFSPAEVAELVGRHRPSPSATSRATIEVTGETTIAAARRLTSDRSNVAALNFASARSPGGGFLTGARAQEESLCRASGLYPTLLRAPAYYEANRRAPADVYTDWAIYSPGVPVFRDDELALAPSFTTSFITMPAPNCRDVAPSASTLTEVFRRRVEAVFAIAREFGRDTLVLGAWGCGAFRNDPALVARAFKWALFEAGWARSFERITFAVFDAKREGNLAAFEGTFAHSMA